MLVPRISIRTNGSCCAARSKTSGRDVIDAGEIGAGFLDDAKSALFCSKPRKAVRHFGREWSIGNALEIRVSQRRDEKFPVHGDARTLGE